MITGENPRYPSTAGGHEGLKRELHQLGVRFDETEGRYGGKPERSLIVYGLPREHLFALGQKYGQEAVIHSEGGQHQFIYTNGPRVGQMHLGTGAHQRWAEGAAAPVDDYTRVPGHGHVRLQFDWDRTHAAAPAPAPPPVAAPGVAVTKHEIGHALYNAINGVIPARNLGATGMSDPVKKSQRSQDVAENKNTSVPEMLHGLYKTISERVSAFERDCLELRKAELAKKSPPGRKEEVEKLKEKGLPASEAFGIAWKQHNKLDKTDGMEAPVPGGPGAMAMSEDDKLDAYAKGELNMTKTEMCKACGMKMSECDCSKAEAYAKGEDKWQAANAKATAAGKKGVPVPPRGSPERKELSLASDRDEAKKPVKKNELAKAQVGPTVIGQRAMAARKKFGDRTMAEQERMLPQARASAGALMDNMLASGKLNVGQPLAIKPIAHNPLTPVGARSDVGGGPARPLVATGPVKTMAERVAAKVPSAQAPAAGAGHDVFGGAPATAGLTPPTPAPSKGMSPILSRHLKPQAPAIKSELPAGASPDAPGPKGDGKLPGKPEMLNGDNENNGGVGKIKKAGAMPTAPKPPTSAPTAASGSPSLGMPKQPKLPKPAKPAAPKTPAMGAGQPALKTEDKPEPKKSKGDGACPSRDTTPGARHVYKNGKCVFCSETN